VAQDGQWTVRGSGRLQKRTLKRRRGETKSKDEEKGGTEVTRTERV